MKKLFLIFFVVGLILFFFSCQQEHVLTPDLEETDGVITSLAKKPTASISCTTDYDFVGHLGIFDAEGRLLAWKGTISGDIVGVIKWWSVLPMSYTGQASHYEDRFEVWNAAETELLLAGDEAGSTTARHGKNSNWRTNGTVTEVGQGFEDWLGRQEHAEGHFTWAAPGLPEHGTGTFRVAGSSSKTAPGKQSTGKSAIAWGNIKAGK